MALICNVATATVSGAGSLLTQVPGGNYELVVVNNAGGTVFLGTSAAVTSSNGCPIPNGQSIKLSGVAGGAAGALYVVLGGGSASGTVGYVLTTSV